MKALTIRQPWAQLIVAGLKDVENRPRRTRFRGRLAIHAGSVWAPKRDYADLPNDEAVLDVLVSRHGRPFALGAVIGTVEVVDCVSNHRSVWAQPNGWHWVLADPVLFDEPIPAKGRLGLWEVELGGEAKLPS